MLVFKNYPKIGLLDSGSGGLSILEEIIKKIPQASYQYLCDNFYFPYGELSQAVLKERVLKICERFVSEQRIDLLVLPCNTASATTLDLLRERLSIPIIGVVPAIKTAAEFSKTKHIGIIATKATIGSSYLEGLIKQFAFSCKVTKKHSNKLVQLSEQKLLGQSISSVFLEEELGPFFLDETIDSVVLGCTHYSFLLEDIKKFQPRKIQWIDTKIAIAKRVEFILKQKSSEKKVPSLLQKRIRLFYTKENSFSEEQKFHWKRQYSIDSFHFFQI